MGVINKHNNVVGNPAKQLNDYTVKFNLDGKPIEFDILANVTEEDLEAVIINWTARTSKFTAKSLVNYINSKGQYGFKAKLN